MTVIPEISITFRIDQRIKVVEVATGNRKFLVPLETFSLETGIRDFSESTTGKANISTHAYSSIWKGQLLYAEPNSFRFRRAKTASETE